MILNNLQSFQKNKNIKFGYNVTFDTGASKNGGSIEGKLISSKTDEVISSFPEGGKGVVCPDGIENQQDYVNHIATIIEKTVKKSQGKINNLQGKDKTLESIIGFVPGQTKSNGKGFEATILPNIKANDGNSLRKVDYSKIPTMLKQKGIKISKEIKNIEVNDLMGATLSLAKLNQDKLRDGFKAAVLYPGGGLWSWIF